MTTIAQTFRQRFQSPSDVRNPSIREQESKLAMAAVVFFFVTLNIQIVSTAFTFSILAVFLIFSVLYHRQLYYFLSKNWIVLVFPAIVLLSAMWSNTPSDSLWYGIQLCVTIAIGVLLGVSSTQRQLVLGVFIGTAIVTIVSLASGRTGASASGPVLIGVTGSKDQMGFVALTLFASALAVLFDRHQRIALRLAALCLMPVGAYIATHVDAAAAMVATACAVAAFLAVYLLRYFYLRGRIVLVVVTLVALVPASVVAVGELSQSSEDGILRALGKDRTLTGRTIMWDLADHWIEQEPLIGHGYRSFWLGNSSDSTSLLHHFGLTDGRLFQFHNTYKEILVDTGWLGLVSLLITGIIFLFYVVADAFLNPGAPSAFIVSMFLLLIARSSLETIILTFYPYTVLFYACGTAAIVYFMNKPTSEKRGMRGLRSKAPISALSSNIATRSG